ncbi:MAG: hypothetical protein IJ763_04325 [Lachnospiraceae bacterium]|nr:hypothetical protein [Lachnospiraceae bacterium]
MKKDNQKNMERELLKALAIEYVKSYCIENGLSYEKLRSQSFIFTCNECAFAQISNIEPKGLINDAETMPKVTLIIRHENDCLKIIETEYTKEFLEI